MAFKKTAKPNRRLIEILTDVHDDEDRRGALLDLP